MTATIGSATTSNAPYRGEWFWNLMARRYSRQPVGDMAAYEATLDHVRRHLSADDHVLEIGCGTGTTALKLADSARHITATDYSSTMIGIATEKAAHQGVQAVAFRQATVFDEAFEPASFDAVLAFNLLHLMRDQAAVLRRVRELLRPDGLFMSKTPCLAGKGAVLKGGLSFLGWTGLLPRVRFMSVDELDGIVAAAGFEIVDGGLYPASLPSRFVVARKPAAGQTGG
jgi:ubiquinone/menaquinone biosynthesis C-methylase UbiE